MSEMEFSISERADGMGRVSMTSANLPASWWPLPARAAVLGLAMMLLPTCAQNEDACRYGQGPWGPSRYGEVCDAPPEVIVNALDRVCNPYRCYDGRWEKPTPGETDECTGYLLEQTSETTLCPLFCVADLQPDSPDLDYSCEVGYDDFDQPDDAPAFELPPRCDVSGNEWVLPPGATACIGYASQQGNSVDAVPTACAQRGVNLGFELVGGPEPIVPPYIRLYVQCQWQFSAQPPCPDSEPVTPDAMPPEVCERSTE